MTHFHLVYISLFFFVTFTLPSLCLRKRLQNIISEPSTFDLKVDGKNDLCTKGEDINFVLNAFAVEGILRSGDGNGPADVALILIAENGTVISEAKTVANGAYRFRASPGKYLVSHFFECFFQLLVEMIIVFILN